MSARLVALALALLIPPGAFAATFRVHVGLDDVDVAPGDGRCAVAAGTCTLRAAIQEANALAGPDEILLPDITLTLAIEGRDEDAAAAGDLDITDDVVIRGEGAGRSVVRGLSPPATSRDRVFDVLAPVSVVRFEALTITGGRVQDLEIGAGLRAAAGIVEIADVTVSANSAPFGGGGVAVIGATVLVARSLLEFNSCTSGLSGRGGCGILVESGSLEAVDSSVQDGRSFVLGRGQPGTGVAVYSGTARLTGCSLLRNRGTHGAGLLVGATAQVHVERCLVADNMNESLDGEGGGIAVEGGALVLVNTTVAGNRAGLHGGGVALRGPVAGSLRLESCTLAGNSVTEPASAGGGLFIEAGHSAIALNSVVADNGHCVPVSGQPCSPDPAGPADDVAGSLESEGHVLVETTAGMTLAGDMTGVLLGIDPLLAASDDSGFLRPCAGSPLIEAGNPWLVGTLPGSCPTEDGEGALRAMGARCDIGAAESPCVGSFDPMANADGDCWPDACDPCTDPDGDGTGVAGPAGRTCGPDNCPSLVNPDQADADGDGLGDACDACPDLPASGTDLDLDGIDDGCDGCIDADTDGFADVATTAPATCGPDDCPGVADPQQLDSDRDGLGNACDPACDAEPGDVDLDPSEHPLRLRGIDATRCALTWRWQGSLVSPVIFRGSIPAAPRGLATLGTRLPGSPYDHAPIACTNPTTFFEETYVPGSFYYLVAMSCAGQLSSAGRDSTGTEIGAGGACP